MRCRDGVRLTEPDQAGGASARLIGTDTELDAALASLGTTVALDTEFIRVRTFYPIPALYQLAGNGIVVLIDAQSDATFAALTALLVDEERTKIVHACSEDLDVFDTHLDVRPVNLVDTQLAHAFLGEEFSASYAKLVEGYLGVSLDKHETRSDWLKRPLSAQQVAYAREDVAHLPAIWQRQREALAAKGRLAWFLEDMRTLLTVPCATPDTWFETIKGASRLSDRERAVLRSLVRWRENEARRRDLPRAYTVRDQDLLALARRKQLAQADVAGLLPRRTARRYGRVLVRVHREGLEDPCPPAAAARSLSGRERTMLKELRAVGRRESERLGMAPELLCRKRDLDAVVLHHREHGELPPRYREGWRREIVAEPFNELLGALP